MQLHPIQFNILMGNIKQILNNCTCYFFNDKINIKNFV